MKKWLVILAFPTLAQAATVYSVSDGFWTNNAVWSTGGQPATADSVIISNSITANGTRTVSNLTVETGSLVLTSGVSFTVLNTATINGQLAFYNGTMNVNNLALSTAPLSGTGSITGYGTSTRRFRVDTASGGATNDLSATVSSLVISNMEILRFGSNAAAGTNSHTVLTNAVLFGKTATVELLANTRSANINGSSFPALDFTSIGNATVSFDNGTVNGAFTCKLTGTNTLSLNNTSIIATNLTAIALTGGTTTLFATNSFWQNWAINGTGNILPTTLSQTGMVVEASYAGAAGSMGVNGQFYKLLSTKNTLRLSAAANCNLITITGGTFQPAGYAVTADAITNSASILIGSNSVFTVTSFVNAGTWTPQASEIKFGLDTTQGVLSNVTSAFNLGSAFAGKSIKIISNLTVTSTASFSASGSSPGTISGSPCLLTLSNAGTAFGYGLSNIGVAAYRPLYTWGGVTDRKTATGNVQQVGRYQIIQ